MKTSIIICSILLTNHSAFAWQIGPVKGDDPVIVVPPIIEVVQAVENAMPISPKSVTCNQTREDANHHQAELKQTLEGAIARLNDTDNYLNTKLIEKASADLAKTSLEKQEALLLEFQNLNTGLIISENTIKSALFHLQSRNTDQALEEVLLSMEAQTVDPSLRQFALLIRTLALKNSTDLTEVLENENGKILLGHLSLLLGAVQVSLAQQKAQNNDFISKNETSIAQLRQLQTELTTQVSQINSEISAQEERKSCKS
jgi:hypothetical protein